MGKGGWGRHMGGGALLDIVVGDLRHPGLQRQWRRSSTRSKSLSKMMRISPSGPIDSDCSNFFVSRSAWNS